MSDPRAIVPGRGIGQIRISEPLPASLPEPTGGDAAMGRFEQEWRAGSYRLTALSRRVFEPQDRERVVVKVIRIESPYFRTPMT